MWTAIKRITKVISKYNVFILCVIIPLAIAIVLANVYPYYNHPPWKNDSIYPYSRDETIFLIFLSFYLSFTVLIIFTVYPVASLSTRLEKNRKIYAFHLGLIGWCSIPLIIGLVSVIIPLSALPTIDLEKARVLYRGFDYAQTIYSIELLINIPLSYTLFYIIVNKNIKPLRILRNFVILLIIGYIIINASMITQALIDLSIVKIGHRYLYIYFRGYDPDILDIMNRQNIVVEALLPTWGFLIGLIIWALILKRIIQRLYL